MINLDNTEVWARAQEFPDYEVSSCGRVRSYKKEGLSLKGVRLSGRGYPQVDLYVFGLRHTVQVHRLVAKAFIPNPDNLPEVNHLNGIKTDNRVENLEWCDRPYNMRHSYRIGLRSRRPVSSQGAA